MRSSISALALTGLLAAVAFVSCNNEQRQPVPCASDDECVAPRTCQDGACVAPVLPNVCTSDGDCRGGTCIDGVCTNDVDPGPEPDAGPPVDIGVPDIGPPPTDIPDIDDVTCVSSEECALDQVCVGGLCERRACAGDRECPEDAVCVGELCRYAPVCNGDGDCDAVFGRCVDGRCIPGCVSDPECGDSRGRCVNGECLLACDDEGACPRGSTCEDGFCLPTECRGRLLEDCPDGERCNGNGRCEPYTVCDDDFDCPDAQACQDGICEPTTPCVSDVACGDGQICANGRCIPSTECTGDDECPRGTECTGGTCVPALCRGNADCSDGEVCDAGQCIPIPVVEVSRVVILTQPDPMVPGQTLRFRALALDEDEQVIVGQTFDWESSMPSVGNFAGPNFTAGTTAGTTFVTARPRGAPSPVSDEVEVVNLGAINDDEARVTVVDRASGQPIRNADVIDADGNTTTTNNRGVANLDPLHTSAVTVVAPGYNVATIFDAGPGPVDLLLPLAAATGASEIAGFTGAMNYDSVATSGNVAVGLAGSAIGGDLVDLDLTTLLGDTFNTEVDVPFLGRQNLPLPGGIVARIDFLEIGDVKADYYARSLGGFTFAWSLAGRVPLNRIISLFTSGGAGDVSRVLGFLLPLFESFDHDLVAYDTPPRPLVPDTNDINNNGNRTELLPDYRNFPRINMRPRVSQAYRTEVAFPPMPTFGGSPSEVVVLVGGVVVESVGLVPTGISAGTSEGGAPPADVVLRMAPSHSGLGEGDFAVLALTFGGGQGAANLAGIIYYGDQLPRRLRFDQRRFTPLASDATWNPGTRQFNASDVGADMYRVTLVGATRSWDVYLDGGAPLAFDLPALPGGTNDPVSGSFARVESYDLSNGNSFTSLITPGGRTLRDVNRVIEAFGRFEAR